MLEEVRRRRSRFRRAVCCQQKAQETWFVRTKRVVTNIFEILEKIGDRLPLAISKDGLVQAIAGFSCREIRNAGRNVIGSERHTSTA